MKTECFFKNEIHPDSVLQFLKLIIALVSIFDINVLFIIFLEERKFAKVSIDFTILQKKYTFLTFWSFLRKKILQNDPWSFSSFQSHFMSNLLEILT